MEESAILDVGGWRVLSWALLLHQVPSIIQLPPSPPLPLPRPLPVFLASCAFHAAVLPTRGHLCQHCRLHQGCRGSFFQHWHLSHPLPAACMRAVANAVIRSVPLLLFSPQRGLSSFFFDFGRKTQIKIKMKTKSEQNFLPRGSRSPLNSLLFLIWELRIQRISGSQILHNPLSGLSHHPGETWGGWVQRGEIQRNCFYHHLNSVHPKWAGVATGLMRKTGSSIFLPPMRMQEKNDRRQRASFCLAACRGKYTQAKAVMLGDHFFAKGWEISEVDRDINSTRESRKTSKLRGYKWV